MAMRCITSAAIRIARGPTRCRFFSTSLLNSSPSGAIKILYGSQTGTAQLFANQLAEGLEENGVKNVEVVGLDEKPPNEILAPGDLHLVVASCAGRGEPPDNARKFYDWIMMDPSAKVEKDVNFAVFGLGNKSAHPNNYNVVAKRLDARLGEMGAHRIADVALGDDGGCIENDFDEWMAAIISDVVSDGPTEQLSPSDMPIKDARQQDKVQLMEDKLDAVDRSASMKFPTIALDPAQSDVIRRDLFHLSGPNRFYAENTKKLEVIDNRILTPDAGESALHEIQVSLRCHDSIGNEAVLSYTTGDHFLVYPRNSDAIVDAYVKMLRVDPHAIISESQHDSYSYPRGLTVTETLSHCIDLGAPPSPSFSRMILGRKDVDYIKEIATPRRTVIDLCQQAGTKLTFEDFIHNAVPIKPRYYSIASSSIKFPNEIILVYRPVRYMTSKGYLREGLCTSFLAHKGAAQRGVDDIACLPALVVSNPTFRLPPDTLTPVLFIGGGCGVAPIRAFIEERIVLQSMGRICGPATLFLGFRNPHDEVYQGLVQEALKVGALSSSEVVYSSGSDVHGKCQQMLVSELVRQRGGNVWRHFQDGGHAYVCGGARTFGAAIEAAFLDIFQMHGNMNFDGANEYMRELVDTGRLAEDLAN
jgi:sulfite reductase alpha subunit-like flavoprotein